MPIRPLKLGVIASEFFDARLGRMGGFGWAARQLGELFNGDPALAVELVYLAAERAPGPATAACVHGSRIVMRKSSRIADARDVRREHFDLLLTIDYNLAYGVYLRAAARTPAVVWVRDPRTPQDLEKIASLRIPGQDAIPQGLEPFDCHSMGRIVRESRWFGRSLQFASPAPFLVSKMEGAYGEEPWDFYFLPNVVAVNPARIPKTERPSAIFVGRLDPIKRPWIFCELARRFPHVQFIFLGQSHFRGPGSWHPEDLPQNVRMAGHVDGEEKLRLLSQAWVMINTSIHEGLPVSFLEALACATPLLSCQDPGFVTSRYGIYTGRFDGSGMNGLDSFSAGLDTLLSSDSLRNSLGEQGREWVRSTHSRERFLTSFGDLCRRAGVAR